MVVVEANAVAVVEANAVAVVEANAVVVAEANALVLEHLLLLLLPPYPFYGSAFPFATSLSKHIQIGMDFLQTQTQVQTLHFIVHYNYHFVLFVLLLLNLHE